MEQIHDRGNSVGKIEQIHIMLIVTYTKNDYIVSRGEIKKSKPKTKKHRNIGSSGGLTNKLVLHHESVTFTDMNRQYR